MQVLRAQRLTATYYSKGYELFAERFTKYLVLYAGTAYRRTYLNDAQPRYLEYIYVGRYGQRVANDSPGITPPTNETRIFLVLGEEARRTEQQPGTKK